MKEKIIPTARRSGFDFDWRFCPDLPSLRARYTGGHKVYQTTRTGQRCPYGIAGFDDSGWQKINLPHDWLVSQPFDPAALGSQGYVKRGTAWYRKEFCLGEDCRDKQILLCFDGVAGLSEVYVNGSLMEQSCSSYSEFTVDITDRAYFGDSLNSVAVFVDRSDVELWAYEGAGIHRHVWLLVKDTLHVAHNGLWVKSKPKGDDHWEITAEVTVENSSYTEMPFEVSIQMTDEKGVSIASGNGRGIATADARNTVTVTMEAVSPALWDIDAPNLYYAKARVTAEGIEDWECVIHGFRNFRAEGATGFFLNEKPIKIYGSCCHQGHAGVGTAVPDAIVNYRMEKLKELGINAFRCVHHNPSPELLDACDRLGILVMDENRHFETGSDYLAMVENMVKRDRNHPSVVFYALFNEEPIAATPEGGKIFRRLASVVRRLDDTRLLTGAMNMDTAFGKGGAAEVMDVVGLNYQLENFEAYHRLHPETPLIGCENAATFGTRGQYVTDMDRRMIVCDDSEYREDFNSVRDTFRVINSLPFAGGMFLWSGYDYRGEPVPGGWPAVASQFGLMDSCGFPKGGYYYARAFLKTEPFVKLLNHWQHRPGEVIDLSTVTNCQEVELILNGRSLGKRFSNPITQLKWEVTFEEGKLEAIGYREGKAVARDALVTASAPERILLQADRSSLRADGTDALPVTVSLVDGMGIPVVCDDRHISFRLEGEGRILGCGNGDPTSHEIDTLPERDLFAGLCSVLVQAGCKDGSLTLYAEGDGLTEGTLTLKLIN